MKIIKIYSNVMSLKMITILKFLGWILLIEVKAVSNFAWIWCAVSASHSSSDHLNSGKKGAFSSDYIEEISLFLNSLKGVAAKFQQGRNPMAFSLQDEINVCTLGSSLCRSCLVWSSSAIIRLLLKMWTSFASCMPLCFKSIPGSFRLFSTNTLLRLHSNEDSLLTWLVEFQPFFVC